MPVSDDGSNHLVSVERLAELLGAPDLRVFDTRWYLGDPDRGLSEYQTSHIPGAVFVDLETQLTGRRGPGRHPLPDPVRFAATLGRIGVDPESRVVVYDSSGGAIAARMWWMLRALGHRSVGVLDGGWQTWLAAGLPVDDAIVPPKPVAYPVLMSAWPRTVNSAEIQAGGSHTLIDARAAERYRGEVEPIDARPGHIPGAINLPHTGNLAPNGTHLPAEVLAERFAGVGSDPVVYCGSGVTACANILAMEVAGILDARLYPGSWSDWASQPALPATLGDRP